MSRSAFRVERLWKRFGARDALAGVSLSQEAGTCLAVLGTNGSGKTTLLRMLATLAQPSEGTVEVLGEVLPARADAARRRIGVVLRRHLLPRDLPLREGLRMYADLYGVTDAERRIEELADRLGIASRLRDPVRTFSRGMGQRASLCRALLHDPEFLLFDEPFTGLDAVACRAVENLVRDTCARGRSVVLVTHDLERAGRVADRGVVFELGRLVFDGAAAAAAEAAGAGAAA